MVIDLRVDYRKNDQCAFTVFDPPKTCNTIPGEPFPAEYYFDQSRICLIPRPGINYMYIVFASHCSYHVSTFYQPTLLIYSNRG